MLIRRSLVCALSVFAMGLAQGAAVVGQPAPDFTVKDASGKEVKLSQYRGKHVVLEWINPDCPFVRKHYDSGNMPATQKEATAKGVVWLSVYSTDDKGEAYIAPDRLQEWVRAKGAQPTAVLLDGPGNLGHAYGARTTPHMYLIGPSGTLLYAGGIDSIASSKQDDIPKATNYVRQAVNEVLAGKAVSTPSSAPYGCSVKYRS